MYEQAWLSYDRMNWDDERRKEWQQIKLVVEASEDDADTTDSELARLQRAIEEINRFFQVSEEEITHVIILRQEMIEGVSGAYELFYDVLVEDYNLSQKPWKMLTITGDGAGILYGVFHVIRQFMTGKPIESIQTTAIPDNALRMLNHWDNFDGSIERGYSGTSFFFDNDLLINDRTEAYARLNASVGINGVVINNVNVRGEACELILPKYYEKLRTLSELFDSYGIKLFLSVDFAAPIDLGGLSSADPLNPEVIQWWKDCCASLYQNVPLFGGFLVKADSEGRPGPFTYDRTHAEGANMLARAVLAYGGLIIWRCFVYNCTQNWRDQSMDRARAGYDNFKPLDGLFDDNVILQVKNGPMDFQVREPVSPLFGAMPKTNQMLEVQIAQEYTGQQIDLCYLIPWFQEVLSFETYARAHKDGEAEDVTTVAGVINGRAFGGRNCGIAAVANTGNDANWTGHDLAAANWYGFGRLAFATKLSALEIAREWTAMTFGTEHLKVLETLPKLLMQSWPVYEAYTAPLGIGWMCNPNHHYGVNVEGYEYDRWGTYHRADIRGIGVDRSSKGTGYATQYFMPNATRYEQIDTCPMELLLFFHRVPYTYVLPNHVTLLQHIYNTHFEGVEALEGMISDWEALSTELDEQVFERVLLRFRRQHENAVEWRDRINTYFYRMTLIPDEKGRRIY